MSNIKAFRVNPLGLMAHRGDALIEALASTLVLGIVVAGITQASRITTQNQRDAVVQDMYTQQAAFELSQLTQDTDCEQNLRAMTTTGSRTPTKLSIDCNKTLTAVINGKNISNISSAKTGTLDFGDTDRTFKIGLRAKERSE